jgi:hypothetical protein
MAGRIWLRGLSPGVQGKVWTADELLRVGQNSRLDVTLHDPWINPFHAEVRLTPQGWMVQDLGSSQGTFLNDCRLGVGWQLLRAGDKLRFGSVVVGVSVPPTDPCTDLPGLLDEFAGLFDAHTGKLYLQELGSEEAPLHLAVQHGTAACSGDFPPGPMVCEVFSRGQGLLVRKDGEDETLRGIAFDLNNLGSTLFVMLRTGCGRRLGVVELWRTILQEPFTEDDLRQAEALLAQRAEEYDIMGNSVVPGLLDPAWLTWGNRAALSVAEVICRERRFEEMAVLGDIFEEAGCTDQNILRHCRSRGRHGDGCLVLRLVLQQGEFSSDSTALHSGLPGAHPEPPRQVT